jgi:hypothetical protein
MSDPVPVGGKEVMPTNLMKETYLIRHKYLSRFFEAMPFL